jgi:sigma54-dependent transcription regulator
MEWKFPGLKYFNYSEADSVLKEILGEEKAIELDLFDQMQIEKVI